MNIIETFKKIGTLTINLPHSKRAAAIWCCLLFEFTPFYLRFRLHKSPRQVLASTFKSILVRVSHKFKGEKRNQIQAQLGLYIDHACNHYHCSSPQNCALRLLFGEMVRCEGQVIYLLPDSGLHWWIFNVLLKVSNIVSGICCNILPAGIAQTSLRQQNLAKVPAIWPIDRLEQTYSLLHLMQQLQENQFWKQQDNMWMFRCCCKLK